MKPHNVFLTFIIFSLSSGVQEKQLKQNSIVPDNVENDKEASTRLDRFMEYWEEGENTITGKAPHLQVNFQPTEPKNIILKDLVGRFQGLSICLALCFVYLCQMTRDFISTGKLMPTSKVSTILMFGGNFRGLGESWLVTICRLFTCSFLHGHLVHLGLNLLTVISAWLAVVEFEEIFTYMSWPSHWSFALFMFGALSGGVYSYNTTLLRPGLSIGASGGSMGLCSANIAMHVYFGGLQVLKSVTVVYNIALIIFSCVPWDRLVWKLENGRIDVGAHSGGVLAGFVGALALSVLFDKGGVSDGTLKKYGVISAVVFAVLVMLAFLEVVREYLVDGKELVVRAYIKWLNLDTPFGGSEEDRRHTTNGRIYCDVMTDDYLFLLETEGFEDDPELILNRLKRDNEKRRNSSPDLGGVSM